MTEVKHDVKETPIPSGTIEREADCPTLAVDGCFYRIDAESVALTFYTDHDEWQTGDTPNTVKNTGRVRKVKFEIRIPTTRLYYVAKLIIDSVERIRKNPDKGYSIFGPLRMEGQKNE